MKASTIVTTLAAAAAVSASGWTIREEGWYIAFGCRVAINKNVDFCGEKKPNNNSKCVCKNKNALASWLNCGYTNWPHEKEAFDRELLKLCAADTNNNLTQADLDSTWSKLGGKVVNIDTLDSFNRTSPTFPVDGKKIKKAAWGGYWGQKHRWKNVDVSHYLGIAFLAFVGLVLFVTGIINWLARISRAFANQGTNKIQNGIRKHLTLGIFPRHLQSNEFGGGINPDRLEAFFIAAMVLYSILTNFILGFDWFVGNLQFKNKQVGMSRYYGDRSGIILSYQIPLLFLFPGRNNFFQYITRWKQSRFLAFHKWIARIVICEVLVHSFAMASQMYGDYDKFAQRMSKDYYRYGIVSTVFFCIIVPFAIPFIRNRWYEIFLVVHIVLAAFALWTAYVHCLDQDYQQYYWACVAIWLFDRFARLARIFFTGGVQTVEIQHFPSDGSLRFTTKQGLFNAAPGSHSFVHFITPRHFYQSHPLTCVPSIDTPGQITYVARVKTGITKFLADQCIANGGSTTVKVAVDGYYGEHSHYHYFDRTLLIAGGTGISGPYSIAADLAANTPETHNISLHWSVRHIEDVRAYLPELRALKGTRVTPVIHVSALDAASSSDTDGKEEADGVDKLDLGEFGDLQCTFVPGRIAVEELIKSEIDAAPGSIAIGTCAHPQVVDTARKFIAKSLSGHTKRIEYFEEMQQW